VADDVSDDVSDECEAVVTPARSQGLNIEQREERDEEPAGDVRSHIWCFRISNWQNIDPLKLNKLKADLSKAKYWIMGKEICPTTGTPHLQCFVWYNYARVWSAMQKTMRPVGAWFKKSRGSAWQNLVYCKKDGDFEEHGERPVEEEVAKESRGEGSRKRWRNAIKLAEERDWKRLKEEEPHLYLTQQSGLKRVAAAVIGGIKESRLSLDNTWCVGEPGTGKSKWVRDFYGVDNIYYLMPNNPKWWDGYVGQSVVCVEDIGPEHAIQMGWVLKVVGDWYPFNVEIKNDMLIGIRPLTVICTSNCTIEQVFGGGPGVAALVRRFRVKHFE